jgi:adenosyl cobinamide kinase/adenosyl cobinamide phosphate guanylyltransferase
MPLTLILGGARSGKSRTAVALAQRQHEPVTFLATGEGRDVEMRNRIARHRLERPDTWTTVEEPLALHAALDAVPATDCLIIDCLTLWTSNELEVFDANEVEAHAFELSRLAQARIGSTLVVSNEVGMGIVSENQLARVFTDVLGRVNSLWAEVASEVLFMVAGRAMKLGDPLALPESRAGSGD